MSFDLDARRLVARVHVVDRPLDAASPVSIAATFVVDPAKPGPVPA